MFQIKATGEELRLAAEFMKKPPVSFTYGGKPFPEGFAADNGVYTSPDGAMRCECPFVTREGEASVEWLPRFVSASGEKSDQIRDVLALDCVFPTDGEAVLYYANGTRGKIDDFALQTKALDEPFEIYSSARSSVEYLPFFNLKTGSGGILFGLGFTNPWQATFTPVEGGIHVRIGMRNPTDFHMLPGESLRHILMLAIFWKGDVQRSFNILRNHLVRWYIPKDENGEPCPPVCCSSWGGMKTPKHIRYLEFIRDAGLKFDCYWMDAGWYAPDHDTDEFQDSPEDWAYWLGDWRVNRVVHPDGLKPISDMVHDMGMKFLLWFNTYACCDGIGWHAEHPEWAGTFVDNKDGFCANPKRRIEYGMNMDIPEARHWLMERVSSTMKENGVDWYREDCCAAAQVPDTTGRTGAGFMKGVEYMYEFWDELCANTPGLLIDNCGGGGTRIDLETLRRSYVLWRTDYNCSPSADPIGAQVGNHGLGHFLPLVNGAPNTNPGSTYTFLSGMYGGMCFPLFTGDPKSPAWFAQDYPVEWHRRMLSHYQLAKPYLSGSFYPLTACTTSREDVMAYQFDRPDLESGIIVGFFRPECAEDEMTVTPVMEPGRYSVTDEESGETFELDVEAGTTVTLRAKEKPQGVLLHYRKV